KFRHRRPSSLLPCVKLNSDSESIGVWTRTLPFIVTDGLTDSRYDGATEAFNANSIYSGYCFCHFLRIARTCRKNGWNCERSERGRDHGRPDFDYEPGYRRGSGETNR